MAATGSRALPDPGGLHSHEQRSSGPDRRANLGGPASKVTWVKDPGRLGSVVEQRFCKAKVIGSNPLAGFPTFAPAGLTNHP